MNESFFTRKLPITRPLNTRSGTGLGVFETTRTRLGPGLTTREGTRNLLFLKNLLNFFWFSKNMAFLWPLWRKNSNWLKISDQIVTALFVERTFQQNFECLANKNAIKILRGFIFGRFSFNITTRKLPGNYPDPALQKMYLPGADPDSEF